MTGTPSQLSTTGMILSISAGAVGSGVLVGGSGVAVAGTGVAVGGTGAGAQAQFSTADPPLCGKPGRFGFLHFLHSVWGDFYVFRRLCRALCPAWIQPSRLPRQNRRRKTINSGLRRARNVLFPGHFCRDARFSAESLLPSARLVFPNRAFNLHLEQKTAKTFLSSGFCCFFTYHAAFCPKAKSSILPASTALPQASGNLPGGGISISGQCLLFFARSIYQKCMFIMCSRKGSSRCFVPPKQQTLQAPLRLLP